jgi:hypothetical protein
MGHALPLSGERILRVRKACRQEKIHADQERPYGRREHAIARIRSYLTAVLS